MGKGKGDVVWWGVGFLGNGLRVEGERGWFGGFLGWVVAVVFSGLGWNGVGWERGVVVGVGVLGRVGGRG